MYLHKMTYLDNGCCLEHLSHKRGHSLELAVPCTHTAEDGVKYWQRRLRTWHEAADLSHQRDYSSLADECRFSSHVWSSLVRKTRSVLCGVYLWHELTDDLELALVYGSY